MIKSNPTISDINNMSLPELKVFILKHDLISKIEKKGKLTTTNIKRYIKKHYNKIFDPCNDWETFPKKRSPYEECIKSFSPSTNKLEKLNINSMKNIIKTHYDTKINNDEISDIVKISSNNEISDIVNKISSNNEISDIVNKISSNTKMSPKTKKVCKDWETFPKKRSPYEECIKSFSPSTKLKPITINNMKKIIKKYYKEHNDEDEDEDKDKDKKMSPKTKKVCKNWETFPKKRSPYEECIKSFSPSTKLKPITINDMKKIIKKYYKEHNNIDEDDYESEKEDKRKRDNIVKKMSPKINKLCKDWKSFPKKRSPYEECIKSFSPNATLKPYNINKMQNIIKDYMQPNNNDNGNNYDYDNGNNYDYDYDNGNDYDNDNDNENKNKNENDNIIIPEDLMYNNYNDIEVNDDILKAINKCFLNKNEF